MSLDIKIGRLQTICLSTDRNHLQLASVTFVHVFSMSLSKLLHIYEVYCTADTRLAAMVCALLHLCTAAPVHELDQVLQTATVA